MIRRSGALLLAFLAAAGAPLEGQEQDGHVLAPGQLRLTAGAEYFHGDERYTGNGTESLGAYYRGPLTPVTFAPLGPVAGALTVIFIETADVPEAEFVEPAALLAGELEIDLATSSRVLPIRLGIGLFPRVELGVQLPVYRNESLGRRFDLTPGNVGINPDAVANREILLEFGEAGEDLAGSPLLPLESSPIGEELQYRVLSVTGQELNLPTEPLDGPSLRQAFPALLPTYHITEWRPGDLEVDLRLQVLRSFDGPFFPAVGEEGVHYRLTAHGAGRFPTGTGRQPGDGPASGSGQAGFAGASGGAVGDLFLGRFWLTAAASYQHLQPADVTLFIPGAGGPLGEDSGEVVVRRSPGDRLLLWAAPRMRLTREIALGGVVRMDRRAEGNDLFSGATTPIASSRSQAIGLTLTYSTLSTPELERGIGVETSLGFTRTIDGTIGEASGTMAFLRFSLLNRLWGSPPGAAP